MLKAKTYTINVALVGSSSVGKTCLMDRLLGKDFNNETQGTLQPYFGFYKFNSKKLEKSIIQIKYWDTVGQEVFRALCSIPIKKSDIIIFVRDKENDNLQGEDGWINFVNDNIKLDLADKKIIFCLNKTDLLNEEEKMEIYEDLCNLAESENINGDVILVSARNSDGIINLQTKIKNFAVNLILDEINKHKHEINICLFGESFVGKTSLISRIINDYFIESTIATLKVIKKEDYYIVVDLKDHLEIKFNYYDMPGQEQVLTEYLDILKKIDIILFVNDINNLTIKYHLIEEKIIPKNKKLIFCINKKDLLLDGNKNKIIEEYLKLNNNNQPLLVSALNGEGIDDLKNLIKKTGIEIIKNKKNQKEESNNSISRAYNNIINLKEVKNSESDCWDEIKMFFSKLIKLKF